MNCPNCSKEVEDNAGTCTSCGFDFTVGGQAPPPGKENGRKRKVVLLVSLLAIAAIILIVAGAILAVVFLRPEGTRLVYEPASGSAAPKTIETTDEYITHLLNKGKIDRVVVRPAPGQRIWVDLSNKNDTKEAKSIIDAAQPSQLHQSNPLQFRIVLESKTTAKAQGDPGWAITTGKDLSPNAQIILPLYEGGTQMLLKLGPTLLTSASFKRVQVSHDPEENPKIDFVMDKAGTEQLAQITQANTNKQLAIVLDNKVLSAPNIKEPITYGAGEITGKFTESQVKELAKSISSAASGLLLPMELRLVEEKPI